MQTDPLTKALATYLHHYFDEGEARATGQSTHFIAETADIRPEIESVSARLVYHRKRMRTYNLLNGMGYSMTVFQIREDRHARICAKCESIIEALS